ncbi:hypothetical protein MNBD_NITROSPINAE01-300 [hydrothermal vent metagenome]|uniref:Glycosyltransferase n=1 Tax=hydrothermal vent metagenome TaxID=652676 RepID=A0A3B1BZ94_9ZZZZ
MRITFLVRSLEKGGAERQLATLALGLKRRGVDVTAVVFYSCADGFDGDLEKGGIRVISLNKKGRWDVVPFLFRLIKTLRAERPDIIHSYLDVSNLLTAVFKKMLRPAKIVWGVRASHMDFSKYDFWLGVTNSIASMLSRYADLVIVNSNAGRSAAIDSGYPAKKVVMINNGIDTDKFDADLQRRMSARKAWGIGERQKVIGLPARIDPMKDHPTFLRAVAEFKLTRNDVAFVLAGGGPQTLVDDLKTQAQKLGIEDSLIWLGEVVDMPEVYNGFDIATLTSSGEGFPNVIGEAMACGVPCVVTDVGDAATIVGETGAVVPPKNPTALAAEWNRMIGNLEKNKNVLKQASKERIVKNFSIDKLVDETLFAMKNILIKTRFQ